MSNKCTIETTQIVSEQIGEMRERDHIQDQCRDLVSFAGHILTALGIDGEQDNAGNIALDRVRELISKKPRLTATVVRDLPGRVRGFTQDETDLIADAQADERDRR